jgi:AcrR family transcriptional regulator
VVKGKRFTADERREMIVAAAGALFARRGYFGTPTVEIARAAELSEGYMFRLIGTKEALFVAVVERSFDAILDTFRRATTSSDGQAPEELLDTIGKSYANVLADHDLLLIQLHAAAACTEPAIREAVRRGFKRMVEFIRRETGVDDAAIQEFFAVGMLANFIAAMGAERLAADWARTLVGDLVFHA